MTSPICLIAQTGCSDFDKWVKIGNNALKKNNLNEALNGFQKAQIAADECKIGNPEADEGVRKVFMAIKKQKFKAEKAREEADKARKIADLLKIEADNAKEIALKQKKEIEIALKKSKSLNKIFEAQTILDKKPTEALLFANEAFNLDKSGKSLKLLMDSFFNVHYNTRVESKDNISAIAMSPKTKTAAIAFENGKLIIVNDRWEKIFEKNINQSKIIAIRFDPTGNYLALTGDDLFFKIINIKGEIIYSKRNPYQINSILWKDNIIYLGSKDGILRTWNFETQKYTLEEYSDITLFSINDIIIQNNFIFAINTEGVWKWDLKDRSNKVLIRKMNLDALKIMINNIGDIVLLRKNNTIIKYLAQDNYKKENVILNISKKITNFYSFKNDIVLIEYENNNIDYIDSSTEFQCNWVSQMSKTEGFFLYDNNLLAYDKNTILLWDFQEILQGNALHDESSFDLVENIGFQVVSETDSLIIVKDMNHNCTIDFIPTIAKDGNKSGKIREKSFLMKSDFLPIKNVLTYNNFNIIESAHLQFMGRDSIKYDYPKLENRTYDKLYISSNFDFFLTKEFNKKVNYFKLWYSPLYVIDFVNQLKLIQL